MALAAIGGRPSAGRNALIIDNRTGETSHQFGTMHDIMNRADQWDRQIGGQSGNFWTPNGYVQQGQQQPPRTGTQGVNSVGGPAWTGQQSQSINYSTGGGGGGTNGAFNAVMPQMQGLIDKQMQEYLWARNKNEENSAQVEGEYMNYRGSPTRQHVDDSLAAYFNDPLRYDDEEIQRQMNRQLNESSAQAHSQKRRQAAIMAANGQLDSASMLAMNERMGYARDAQNDAIRSQLLEKQADSRVEDMRNLSQTLMQGAQLGQADVNLFHEIQPQYTGMDMSGFAGALASLGGLASLGQQQSGQTSFGPGFQGGSFTGFQGGGDNRRSIYERYGSQPDTAAGFEWEGLRDRGLYTPGATPYVDFLADSPRGGGGNTPSGWSSTTQVPNVSDWNTQMGGGDGSDEEDMFNAYLTANAGNIRDMDMNDFNKWSQGRG